MLKKYGSAFNSINTNVSSNIKQISYLHSEMITTINKDNSKWRLVYNESVILLEKVNKLSFDIDDKTIPFKFNLDFVFLDEGEKFGAKIEIAEDGKSGKMILYQWESENAVGHIENKEPLKLTTVNGTKLWFKYRTQTSPKNDWRNFHLSVWAEVK